MKVVLDTNILLVSIPKKSPYRIIFDALLDGKFELIISNEILSEYTEHLHKKRIRLFQPIFVKCY